MTFNQKDKDRFNNFHSPLLKSNLQQNFKINTLLEQIETNFLDFNKYYNDLKEFNRKIPTLTRKEYEKTKDDIHYKIQIIPNILSVINSNSNEIKKLENEITDEIREKLEVIKEKLNPKVEELPNLINEIYEREKIASLKLRNIKLSESELDDSLSIMHSRRSDKMRESKLVIQEVIANQVYLEKRKEELESIKIVSSQLREITEMMGQEVKIQGEKLNEILLDVEAAKENAEQGENEISEAEQGSRRHCKKIIFLSLGIFLLVAIIITIIVLLFIKKNN